MRYEREAFPVVITREEAGRVHTSESRESEREARHTAHYLWCAGQTADGFRTDIDCEIEEYQSRHAWVQRTLFRNTEGANRPGRAAPANLPTQYLPPAPYAAFKKLQQALRKETGTILFAGSGYRSPAYQLVVFLWNVRREHFNVAKVATKVALPGYSEHGNPKRQAIDFTLAKESSKKNKTTMFSNSREYRWLIKNANRFHFYESYPRNNKSGVIYEPWHWHYRENAA
ncbi:MAG: hypothetical protein B7W98_01470 [Parcubacteria group bacterium 20-58-5]|nr:MAG: hypothetical protein B7W98_01470 [Parcubacteria group bacterium 20-58-5]